MVQYGRRGTVTRANLLTLARLTGDGSWHARAERTLAAFGDRLTANGRALPLMLASLSAFHSDAARA
jgi:uncharacterized protein YyaL (SSP411 family)